jgi:hypothetical protein
VNRFATLVLFGVGMVAVKGLKTRSAPAATQYSV